MTSPAQAPEAGKIGRTLPMWMLRLWLAIAAAALVVAVALWNSPGTFLLVIVAAAGAVTVSVPN